MQRAAPNDAFNSCYVTISRLTIDRSNKSNSNMAMKSLRIQPYHFFKGIEKIRKDSFYLNGIAMTWLVSLGSNNIRNLHRRLLHPGKGCELFID